MVACITVAQKSRNERQGSAEKAGARGKKKLLVGVMLNRLLSAHDEYV